MATDSYRIIARFVTIAARYGVGRRQFQAVEAEDEDPEIQLMDYPLHQRRIIPILALGYAMALGTTRLENEHTNILKELEVAVSRDDQNAIKKSINDTKSLFNDSGSLKSTCTWLAADCITECRQTCGGHGYSSYSGFGKAYDDWVVQCTWEGDNNVLGMSVGKTLIKTVELVLKGKKVDSNSTILFLNNASKYSKLSHVLSESDITNPAAILNALEVLIVKISVASLAKLKSNDGDWDEISHARVNLSKLRCHHYLLQLFIQSLESSDISLRPFLDKLIQLYANVWIIEAFSGDFLLNGVIDQAPKILLSTSKIPELCLELRPQVILLTDSFQQPDMVLNSAIGKYNGNIYENYFDVVKTQNPPIQTKAPYSAAVEELLNRQSLEVRQRGDQSDEAKEILSRG